MMDRHVQHSQGQRGMKAGDEDGPPNPLKTFDAFPKVHQNYVQSRSSRGGIFSIALLCIVTILFWTEMLSWWRGTEEMRVSVEDGIGHGIELNVDISVAMACDDLEVNVRDATGDRIFAGEELSKEPTIFRPISDYTRLAGTEDGPAIYHDKVQQILAAAGVRKSKRKFRSKLYKGLFAVLHKSGASAEACRIFGTLLIHKCEGDFHITARGHGYQAFGADHLDHDKINFTHIIDEFSFGEYYPKIANPLDSTMQTTDHHLYVFQYFLSVVPTIYVANDFHGRQLIKTNQYAVTEQSHPSTGHLGLEAPGIFFKYDVEPLRLTIWHGHISTYRFLMRLVALVGGVAICIEWAYKAFDAISGRLDRRRRRASSAAGLLSGAVKEG